MKTRSLEDSVATLLRTGVLVCGALVGAGLFSAFLHGDEAVFATASGLLGGALDLPMNVRPLTLLASPDGFRTPEGFVTLGLCLLIVLPALRVAWLVVAFAKNGERKMSALAAIVLGLLMVGFYVGGA